jgi:hypothetical protein
MGVEPFLHVGLVLIFGGLVFEDVEDLVGLFVAFSSIDVNLYTRYKGKNKLAVR